MTTATTAYPLLPDRHPQGDFFVCDILDAAAPGWDVHAIEAEWRAWASTTPRNPEMAFLGFCKKWAQQRGEG